LIHQRSSRSTRPLATINCAGLPDSLLESELFGHVRGSFTDAYRDRPGWLEQAHRGTIFMDEVGEMSLRMQAILLRFLESGEIQRVGSDRAVSTVDVRVISATNRLLSDRIAAGEFRADLYYRLNVIHIAIPPLTERREDLPLLLEHFFRHYSDRHRMEVPQVQPEAVGLLEAYHWPGNVRELKNIVERLVVRSRSKPITVDDLPPELARHAAPEVRGSDHARARATVLFNRMVKGGESFRSVVYQPFAAHDHTRDDLRIIVRKGLEHSRGSYKVLVELFQMSSKDYKPFLHFLRKHECHMPFQRFRAVSPEEQRRDESAAGEAAGRRISAAS
jgi:transcriptional regulator with PAS, ATPase and Fis domain